MTREEAIKLIEHISIAFVPTDQYGDYDDPQPYEEALDMAIEALSNQQKWIDEELQNYLIENADLVTCKDCKHRSDGGWCDVYIQPRMDTDFCNYGERKGGDTE